LELSAARGIVRDPSELPAGPYPVVALGNFDGVHLGHQAILKTALEHARKGGGHAFALTFDPAPAKVLFPTQAPPLIMAPEDKLDMLCRIGLDGVWVLSFTRELSMLTPRDFVRRHLLGAIGVREVVIGRTINFGHDRAGDASTMIELSREFGFKATVVEQLMVDQIEVSSSRIRELIASGEMKRAARLLGRPHFLTASVIKGRGRGRQLGFPTANLAPVTECIPSQGVYAARMLISGTTYPAIVNIGVRPTFGETEQVIEAHLLNFADDLYGLRVRLEFIERVRSEMKFDSAEELRRQIARDIERVKEILAHPGTGSPRA
jgi:riboflavin kinase/FMN adenylyltransferase